MVAARAPLRITLGGGGTDLPSYYRRFGGFHISAAIDRYVTVRAERCEAVEAQDPVGREAVARYWPGPGGVQLSSRADVPAGTGLGSSGAYATAVTRCLAALAGEALSRDTLAERAGEVEIAASGGAVGRQDTLAATYGGITTFSYDRDGRVSVAPLAAPPETIEELRERLLLFFTGERHSAGAIMSEQDRATRAGDAAMLANLHETLDIGLASRECLERGDLDGWAELLRRHWEVKCARSDSIATERSRELAAAALDGGAAAVKLVGAGGGGFVLALADDPRRLRETMARHGAPELTFDYDLDGCRVEAA
jgi:D-glycero-alpha-D-manno-heptose-7-phosphate kinase